MSAVSLPTAETLPAALTNLRAWLTWKYVQKSGEPKPSKMPYYANGSVRKGTHGSAADRAALVTFEEACAAAKKYKRTGVGLAMLPENGLVALDFDGCIKDGEIDPQVSALVAGTYAEISPSGLGVRAFMHGTLTDHKTKGFEVFHGKGFVTVTGKSIGEPDITELSQALCEHYAARFTPKVASTEPGASVEQLTSATPEQLADIKSALAHPELRKAAGERDVWVKIGLALKSINGRELWDEFIRGADGYDAFAEMWWDKNANSPADSDFRTIFKMAQELGWENPGTQSAPCEDSDYEEITEEQTAPASKVRKPFTFHSLPEDLLTRQLPERRWAIYPYLPAETVTMLTSSGGFGKTFTMLLLSVCKALGLSHFGNQPCEPGRAVILSAEDDLAEMQSRLQRVLRYLVDQCNVQIDFKLLHANLHIVDLTGIGASNMMTRAQQLGAKETDLPLHIAQQIGAADLITVDTLSRFNGASENDNQAGAVFISALEIIAKRTGAAVLVLSHTGKQQAREGVIDQYVSRGASAYSDNSRSGMTLVSPDEKSMKAFDLDKGAVERGDIFRLVHVKSNYAKRADDVFFKRHDGGVVAPFSPEAKPDNKDELLDRLLKYIGTGDITRSKIKQNYEGIFGEEVGRAKAYEIFDGAIKDGHLIRSKTHNQADYYKVADTSLAISDKQDEIHELLR